MNQNAVGRPTTYDLRPLFLRVPLHPLRLRGKISSRFQETTKDSKLHEIKVAD
jgi:hypothetical protein